jgi:hypothetical protein
MLVAPISFCCLCSFAAKQAAARRLGLTEDDRMRVAYDTLRELGRHGEWRELDDAVDGGPNVAQSAKSNEIPPSFTRA